MNRLLPPWLVLALCILALAACSDDDDASDVTAVPPTIPVTLPASSGTAVPSTAVIASANVTALEAVTRAIVEQPQGLAWRPDSSAVLIYGTSKIDELPGERDAPLDHLVRSLPEGERVVEVGPRGDATFLTLIGNDELNVRDLMTSAVVNTIEPEGPISTARFAPDGSQAALQRLDVVAIDLVSMPDGGLIEELSGFETAAPVYGVRFSPDGESLIWVSRATVQIMDLETGDFGPPLQHEEFVSGLALSRGPDGVMLAVSEGPRLHIWDPAAGLERDQVDLPATGLGVAYTPDRMLLAVGTTGGVQLLNAGSLQTVGTLPGNIREVAFSPDGRALATVDEAGEVVIWKVRG
jgi:WD40 repeat protein